MAASVHLIPGRDGGWILRREGDPPQEGRFETREDALKAGRTWCDALRTDLVIHHRDGTVTHE